MSLISRNDVALAAGIRHLGLLGKSLTWLLYHWMEIPKLNAIFEEVKHLNESEFYDALLQILEIRYEVFEQDLKRIPKEGPFILVANHPLGALDGILMMKIISQIRPDFKIMGNFLLKKIPPIQEKVLAVNPFESRKEAFSSIRGIKTARAHLEKGGCLGIFPAGEVSKKNFKTLEIYDRSWQKPAMKLIRNAHVPIVPMYFHAKNSRVFYRWGLIHRDIQTALLPIEMMRKRKKLIKIRVGKVLPVKELEAQVNLIEFSSYIRNKVYLLKSFYAERKNFLKKYKFNTIIRLQKTELIAEPTSQREILREIELLRKDEESLLFKTQSYEVFFSKAHKIPNILREIGRLREITFREVGEGSNKSLDLDAFDTYYYHLFLWDPKEQLLVGAYRLGLGSDIYRHYGIKGFYISSLFHFDKEMHPFFQKSIEMGRAFIRKEYQQKPLPLFTLWKGIVLICLRFPKHQFLIGGVSISNQFSDTSKSLIVEFMRSHYFDSVVGQYIKPRKNYKVKLNVHDREFLNHTIQNDIHQFDKMIDDIEPSELRLPVLIKKYFKQNAKVVAFNVDPKFNDAIDGLMYIKVSDLPHQTVQPILDEYLQTLAQGTSPAKV